MNIILVSLISVNTFSESQFDLDPKFEEYEGGSREYESLIHKQITEISIEMLKKDLGKYEGFNKYPRDAHAKSHGCVKGRFEVNNSLLPKANRLGIFSKNKVYESWIRFSNNDEKPVRKDNRGDLRGIALKVMGVEGEKMMDGHKSSLTQDFLLYGSKEFFIKNSADYIDFIKGLRDGDAVKQLLLSQPVGALKVFLAQQKLKNKVNLFDIDFFSATPIRLGRFENPERSAFKYSVTKCNEVEVMNVAGKKDQNYLRKNLFATLKKNEEACFDFKIQVQTSPEVMPIEDSTKSWPETKSLFPLLNPLKRNFSPYVKVAKIIFNYSDNTDMNSGERRDYCEDLSFNPWHTIPEHKPLGRTMRMRRDVYKGISDFRRLNNGASFEEPDSL